MPAMKLAVWGGTLEIAGVSELALFGGTLARLGLAFVLGTLIGAERQWRQRSAGLRTIVLVTTGAAAFAEIGVRLAGEDGATRIVAYIVSGIGFLGAGVILKDGTNIRGLNTAATLWCSAAVGAFAGTGLLAEAATLAGFVLAGNTLLRPLVNYINRLPISERQTESQYTVHVVCDATKVTEARDLLFTVLEAANYPIRSIASTASGEGDAELAATLVPSSVEPAELDAAVETLKHSGPIKNATWSVEATA